MAESQNIEYKESWRDEYLKWICGFANAQGGKLYIGINDKQQVVGVANSHHLLEDIPNKIVTTLGIVCDVNLLKEGESEYIEIVVEPSNMPIAYKGEYHLRSGATKQQLRGVALQQFILKKMGLSWDNVAMEKATIEEIDRNAVNYFLLNAVDAKTYKKADTDDTGTVTTITVNSKTNNAATNISGLGGTAEGTNYYLVETKEPAGFNKLTAPIIINVKDDGTITVSLNGETLDSANDAFNVENLSGTVLPSTGGMGTTIFYIIGTMLVIGAGVVLVTRRRMDAQ